MSLKIIAFVLIISLIANEKIKCQMNSSILIEVKEYVSEILQEKKPSKYFYHTLKHTEEVVKAAEEISIGEKISQEETEIVLISAWFHDIGYIQKNKGHEEISVMYASNFLIQKNYPSEKIDSVVACILATKVPQRPTSILQEIICDADLHHLGKTTFFERNQLYKKELESLQNKKIDEIEFITSTIAFMNEHHFFTKYAKQKLQPIKDKNLMMLKEQLDSLLK